MTMRGARCAFALAFIALMSSHAVAKDWFGRPDEPCEPKCYWWWWLGRDHAPLQGQPAAATPQTTDQATADDPAKDGAEPAARPVAIVRQATARQPNRRKSSIAVWRVAPLKPFDVFPLAASELTLADGHGAAPSTEPSKRVEASFDGSIVVIARREDATVKRTGDEIAATPSAAAGAEDALKIEGATVTEVPLTDEGLKGVASGSLDAVAIDRFAPGDLRISLAGYPNVTATPLHGTTAPPPGGSTFFGVAGIADPQPFELPRIAPRPAAAPLAESGAGDRSVAVAQ